MRRVRVPSYYVRKYPEYRGQPLDEFLKKNVYDKDQWERL